MKLDVEPFLKQLMAVLLTLRADCSLVTSKSAHLSPYLPPIVRNYMAKPTTMMGDTYR
jgi:hypothetical protein